nr:MAG TPA: hypothetical protein [Caudoviricetes sp.]
MTSSIGSGSVTPRSSLPSSDRQSLSTLSTVVFSSFGP